MVKCAFTVCMPGNKRAVCAQLRAGLAHQSVLYCLCTAPSSSSWRAAGEKPCVRARLPRTFWLPVNTPAVSLAQGGRASQPTSPVPSTSHLRLTPSPQRCAAACGAVTGRTSHHEQHIQFGAPHKGQGACVLPGRQQRRHGRPPSSGDDAAQTHGPPPCAAWRRRR